MKAKYTASQRVLSLSGPYHWSLQKPLRMAADNASIVVIPLDRESGYVFYITFLPPVFRVSPNPMTARSKVCVCSHSLAGIAGLNPARGMDLSVVSVVWCRVERLLWKADHSSTGVLPSVICQPTCDLETAVTRRPRPTRPLESWTTKTLETQMLLTGDTFGDQQQIIRLINPTYLLPSREIIQQ